MFIFNRNTKIVAATTRKPALNAIQMLERDRDKVFETTSVSAGSILLKEGFMEEEQFTLTVDGGTLEITAGDDLGFVYSLLYISEHYLGIKPFWFWMDQKPTKQERVEIENTYYQSEKAVVLFRGWFYNDEVLMLKWKYNLRDKDGWRMAFEALLRCGGNMAIPGTDKLSRENRQLASDMGLWITHHHAEPLGAEMFVRAYPDVEPNFMEQTELFYQLWEEAVLEQKDYRVIWNLCFRGQGDMPFWMNDTSGQFDTPEKQGKLISDIIRKQCDIVKKHVEHPVFCTNLYGEIMELYEQGYIELEQDIIKVRADNGFGKMVTRRRDNHNVRVSSMPDPDDQGAQGIYYHVSFYDLQAANHLTMLPNSVSFVDQELTAVLESGGDDFWMINCSNVRPHVYYLDAVKKKWFGREITDAVHSREFAVEYYNGMEQVAECYQQYQEAMIPYGEHEDEHMGEQYYTENLRIIVNQFLADKSQNAECLYWIAGEGSLEEQTRIVCDLCRAGIDKLEAFYCRCEEVSYGLTGDLKRLFDTTLLLQTKLHYFCAKGVVLFGDAYALCSQKDYRNSFVLFGESSECFDFADSQMRAAEYGVWHDFYLNDCFADVKHTAYMVRKMMSVIRELGDNVRHDKWYHEYCYPKEDQGVYLLLVTDNHMTDWELYQAMKED
ncbi:MAG: glycosyl hydrolase 115 family protein [Suipraeoptans sp.]